MTLTKLYAWKNDLQSHFPELGHWQVLGLALLSLGIIISGTCVLARIAENLGIVGKISTVNKRLKRWVKNPNIDVMPCCEAWTHWVLSQYASEDVVVLVDETKLGQYVGVLKISLAYGGRAIPLCWHCYQANSKAFYPQQGQVLLVWQLVARVQGQLQDEQRLIVQMDRGLGNSSAMLRALNNLGVDYLVRVKANSTFTSRRGTRQTLKQIAQRGKSLTLAGHLFQGNAQTKVRLHLVWDKGYAQPWCLVTQAKQVRGRAYSYRVWQEESFRDLKSGGWDWEGSRVRMAERAARLLLAMSIAYGWMITLGSLAFDLPVPLQRELGSRNDFKRYSLFRMGQRFFKVFMARSSAYCKWGLSFAHKDFLPIIS